MHKRVSIHDTMQVVHKVYGERVNHCMWVITSSSPSSEEGCGALGDQILTSWSRPLVASTGMCGWGSRQFTCTCTNHFMHEQNTVTQSVHLKTPSCPITLKVSLVLVERHWVTGLISRPKGCSHPRELWHVMSSRATRSLVRLPYHRGSCSHSEFWYLRCRRRVLLASVEI